MHGLGRLPMTLYKEQWTKRSTWPMTSEPSFATTTTSSRPRADLPAERTSPRWLHGATALALTGATPGTALDACRGQRGLQRGPLRPRTAPQGLSAPAPQCALDRGCERRGDVAVSLGGEVELRGVRAPHRDAEGSSRRSPRPPTPRTGLFQGWVHAPGKPSPELPFGCKNPRVAGAGDGVPLSVPDTTPSRDSGRAGRAEESLGRRHS